MPNLDKLALGKLPKVHKRTLKTLHYRQILAIVCISICKQIYTWVYYNI